MNELLKAYNFALEAHKGLYRRDGKTPATQHLYGVVRNLAGQDETTLAVAWLHDVIEDTNITAEDLLGAGFSRRVVELVVILTHGKHEPYEDYIKRVALDKTARKIKLADIKENSSAQPTEQQQQKYEKALQYFSTH